jgi:branched-chain amino acid transport system substrate-binding protein
MTTIRSTQRVALAGFAAVFAGLALAAPAVAQATQPIALGGLTFLTGKFSSYGRDVADGMELAVTHINEDGGLPSGAKLVLQLEDTASDSAQAVSLLRRFAGDSSIVGVVGPTGTPDFLATLPITAQLQIPVVSLGSQKAMTLKQFTDWVVRVNLIETPALIKSVLNDVSRIKNIKKLAMLTDRANDFGQAEAASVRAAIKDGAAVEMVSDESYAAGDKDFAVLIDKVMQSVPDAIWISGVTNEASLIMQQARARGFKGVFVGGAGLNDPKIAHLAGDAATGFVTFLPMNLRSDSPVVQRFVRGYKAKHGDKAIATYTGYGYDAVLLLADAIRRSGSIDRTEVMKALGSTKDFQAVTGTYSFQGKGDNISATPFLFRMSASGSFEPLN